ncbi:MAG: hypothetical protein CMB13_02725 [Euryarchaeota archaeon]|nr:hypothetical protein [Euryarchaeota archaeon]
MKSKYEWIVILAIQPTSGRWLMVYHHERGWELPGGRIEDSESVEVAALRELKEEADISGKVVECLNLDSLDSGIVVFVEIDDLENRNEWESQDSKIQRVSFHEEIPEYLYWGSNELKSILDYWSAARTKAS